MPSCMSESLRMLSCTPTLPDIDIPRYRRFTDTKGTLKTGDMKTD